MFNIFGVKGRIGTLFRIYRAAKVKFPTASEKHLLGIVVEEHIPPGKATRLRNLGMKGEQYLDDVFESELPNIDELIYHITTLEFPQKYTRSLNMAEIREQNRSGKPSPRERLKALIKDYHKKIIG